MSDLSDSIDIIERLIKDRANESSIKAHLITLRDRASAIETLVESLQASNSSLQTRIADLEQEAAKMSAVNMIATPRTQRDPCPSCGQPRGHLRATGMDRDGGNIESYYCEGCGESYEKRKT